MISRSIKLKIKYVIAITMLPHKYKRNLNSVDS